MKKLLIFSVVFAATLTVNAQNELNIVPATVSTTGTNVFLDLNNSETAGEILNMQMDIQWPKGWTIAKPHLANASVIARTGEAVEDEDGITYTSNFVCTAGSQKADGTIQYVWYSSENIPLKGGSGHIARIRVTPPAGVEPGIYPVTVKATSYIAKSGDAGSEIWVGENTSYLKVGEPTNQTLTVGEKLPSFVNEKLAKETSITKIDLTKTTSVGGTFTYVPGRAVTAPEGLKANVTYKHAAAAADKYYSMNLPYDAAVECYTLKEIKGGNAEFESASSYTAGENVIVSNAVDYTWNNVDLKSVGEAKTGFYYIGLDGDKNVLKKYSGEKTTAHTLYGTWEASAGSNLRIVVDGELTGISTADIEGVNESYDLQGRRVVNAKNGVYIVNGKKQIVK